MVVRDTAVAQKCNRLQLSSDFKLLHLRSRIKGQCPVLLTPTAQPLIACWVTKSPNLVSMLVHKQEKVQNSSPVTVSAAEVKVPQCPLPRRGGSSARKRVNSMNAKSHSESFKKRC